MKKILIPTLLLLTFGVKAAVCPKEGDATDDKRKNTNINKNRSTIPATSDFDESVTIFKMLNSQDDANAFNESKAATITGYLFKAKDEGPESCNCHSADKSDYDIHIFIAPTKSANSIGECVVIEITPWVKKLHPDWTSAYLNSIAGHKVNVSGWLLYDWEHKAQSAASHPDLERPARGTVWEIHPISDLQDLDADADASASMGITSIPSTNTGTTPPPVTTVAASAPGTANMGTPPTNDPCRYLCLLLIASLLGGLGQFIRILPAIKNMQKKSPAAPASEAGSSIHDVLSDNLRYMVFTIVIAMVIGALAGIVGLLASNDFKIDTTHVMMLIAAGYAGTDLIESFVIRK